MRTASKRAATEIVEYETARSETRGTSSWRYSRLKFIALLLGFAGSAFSQSLAITSPVASQIISGLSFPLTVSLASLPSVASLEYMVDGESQGIVWSPPWSIPAWNTNNRYRGPAHEIWAIARNSLGATIATSPIITFGISNDYLEPASYINLVSVTPSIPFNSTWSGSVSLAAVFNGTNAANNKSMRVFVDGDYSGYNILSPNTATTLKATVNTTQYPDGVHEVCSEFIDNNGTAPTNGGFPFGEDCHQITFANTSTILLVDTISINQSTSTTSVSTSARNLSSGRFVLACGSDFGGGTLSVTDTAGNTYTPLASQTAASYKEQCFHADNVTGNSANVYTLHISGSVTFVDFIVRVYSGVAASSPIDQNLTFTGTNGSCPCLLTSGTFSTTTANELIATYVRPEINNVTFLPGLNSVLDGISVNGQAGGSSQLVNTTQTNTTAMIGTQNAANQPWLMSVITIKAASSTALPTPARVTLSPVDWVIAPTGTIQLTPQIANTDGTTTAVTNGMNPAYSAANSAICTISTGGLVTGVSYGLCTITATLGNGLTETVYGWVSSTNAIPYFGTDGLIHTSGSTPLWVSSFFNSTGGTGFQDLNRTTLQIGTAYKAAGYNTIENNPTDSNKWNGTGNSCATFQANLNTYISTQKTTILDPFGLYFHAPTTPLVTGANPSQFFVGVRGLGATCTPQSWQYLAQQWVATGRLIGMELGDEFDANYSYPGASPVISASGPFTGITCTVSGTPLCTGTYSNPPSSKSGPNKFAIFGGTSTAGLCLNSTIGTPGTTTTLYNFTTLYASTFSFTGPACASGVTISSVTDPSIRIEPFAYEWETANGGGGDYQHYQDFMTLSSLVHAGGSVISAAPRAIASAVAQCGWGGICNSAGSPAFSDYAIIYNQPAIYGTSQYSALPTLRLSPNNVFPQNRAYINGAGALRAFLGQTQAIQLNYGLNGQTVSGISCVGMTCTWPFPHGIYNVIPSVTRVTFSGSSNSYFNAHFFVDSCPTPTTCTISRQTKSQTVSNSNTGTATFDNGNIIANICIGGVLQQNCSTLNTANQQNRGHTFTVTGATGASASYWNSNKFILFAVPFPYNTSNPLGAIREVPPDSQVSGSMTGAVVADNSYTRGLDQNFYGEAPQGPRIPFAFVLAQAITGATGVRAYTLGGDNNILYYGNAFGAYPNSTTLGCKIDGSDCIQGGASMFYDQGAGFVQFFNSPTNINLILQRLASSGYLYAPRGNAPDVGFNIESSLRLGANGNLLLTGNFQDGTQSHSVDLSACDVAGQKKIRYTLDWRSITITELAAGTTTDIATWPAGGAVIYLCPNNEPAEYSPPTMAARLDDVPTASRVTVQYAYSPYLLNQGTSNSVDCGIGVCVLPVDRKIGPLYYRLQYWAANGSMLSSSDVQVL